MVKNRWINSQIVKFYCDNFMNIKEIAHTLGISEARVRNKLYELHLIRTTYKKSVSFKDMVSNIKKLITVGEIVNIYQKNYVGEYDFYCRGKIGKLYDTYFLIEKERFGFKECFLYSDAFTKQIKIVKQYL